MEFQTIVIGQSGEGNCHQLDEAVEEALRHLNSGGLLAHPTTGVYGFGGARESGVEECLAWVKDSGPRRNFVYLFSDIAAARADFSQVGWSDLAEKFAERFWPGALTLVLDDESMTGVALRVEAHVVTRAVLQRWTRGLSSTSLNRTGERAAVTSVEARRVLGELPAVNRPVLLLDVGSLPGPPASTLVQVRGDTYAILRQGAISAEAIEVACR